jgi:hypothetical protein
VERLRVVGLLVNDGVCRAPCLSMQQTHIQTSRQTDRPHPPQPVDCAQVAVAVSQQHTSATGSQACGAAAAHCRRQGMLDVHGSGAQRGQRCSAGVRAGCTMRSSSSGGCCCRQCSLPADMEGVQQQPPPLRLRRRARIQMQGAQGYAAQQYTCRRRKDTDAGGVWGSSGVAVSSRCDARAAQQCAWEHCHPCPPHNAPALPACGGQGTTLHVCGGRSCLPPLA